MTRRKGSSSSSSSDPPPPPPPRKKSSKSIDDPTKKKKKEKKKTVTAVVGLLEDLDKFDPTELAWLRKSSAVLRTIEENGDDNDDDGAVDDETFWRVKVRDAEFPGKWSICTLANPSVSAFQKTMDDWGVDMDDAPDEFMHLIFPANLVADSKNPGMVAPGSGVDICLRYHEATSPAQAAWGKFVCMSHYRYSNMVNLWGAHFRLLWILRAILVHDVPRRFDRYVGDLFAHGEVFRQLFLLFHRVGDSVPGAQSTNDLIMNFMLDAVGADSEKWLRRFFENTVTDVDRDVSDLIMHAIQMDSPNCLQYLMAMTCDPAVRQRFSIPLVKQFSPMTMQYFLEEAGLVGSDVVLRFMSSQFDEYFQADMDYKWNWNLANSDADVSPMNAALQTGDLARAKLLVELGCPFDRKFSMLSAIASGREDVVAFCQEQGVPEVFFYPPDVEVETDDDEVEYSPLEEQVKTLTKATPPETAFRHFRERMQRSDVLLRKHGVIRTVEMDLNLYDEIMDHFGGRMVRLLQVICLYYYRGHHWPSPDEVTMDAWRMWATHLEWMIEHGLSFSNPDELYNVAAKTSNKQIGKETMDKIFARRNNVLPLSNLPTATATTATR